MLEVFLRQLNENTREFTITDQRMTRFFITLNQGVNFVQHSLDLMQGGEIFIPKIPTVKILNLAKALNSKFKIKYMGIRPGEKLHEVLITKNDARNTIEFKKFFIIKPEIVFGDYREKQYKEKYNLVDENFEYSSDIEKFQLPENELKEIIKKYLKNHNDLQFLK